MTIRYSQADYGYDMKTLTCNSGEMVEEVKMVGVAIRAVGNGTVMPSLSNQLLRRRLRPSQHLGLLQSTALSIPTPTISGNFRQISA